MIAWRVGLFKASSCGESETPFFSLNSFVKVKVPLVLNTSLLYQLLNPG